MSRVVVRVFKMNGFKIAGVLDDLKRQGLSVIVHSLSNETWYIKSEGIFHGYVASSDELIELKRDNRLDIRGIESLG